MAIDENTVSQKGIEYKDNILKRYLVRKAIGGKLGD